MDVRMALHALGSLKDLPKLVAELGHHPGWEPVPADAWGSGRQRTLGVTAVGRTASNVPWLGLESDGPERDAVALARRIVQRGQVAVVLAMDSATRRLAVAVAFDRCPCLTLELVRPEQESVASLARLADTSNAGPFAFAARAAEALSAEPVSRRFFREFRATLDRMAEKVPGRVTAEDRHALVLLQLNRVLFLYFIQAKGWLGGRSRFLADHVDRCLTRGRRIQRDLLRPLFFGTLNQPADARSRTAVKFGPIPFLNGGLFEPHPLERRYSSDLPNDLWRDAFDRVFERFHFTVSERGPAGSVAPDMLGRVFEGVMAPATRKASGAFYTPAALVHELLLAALIALLSVRLRCTESAAQRRLGEPDAAVTEALASVTVLDPAAGSGAFLLEALEQLAACGAPASSIAERKRHVLRHNLFGVDSNASAVRLAELRLWLAVIADDPAERPEQVTPLPNLDCLIRQGDSLFEPGGLHSNTSTLRLVGKQGVELSILRQEVLSATGAHKRALVRLLRQSEARVLECSLTEAESIAREQIDDCLAQARAPDLFGALRGLDRELREQVRTLRRNLQELRHARRQLRRHGELPWFHYQSHFADVFAKGGFDLVVGNPPWLRSELIAAALRQRLAARYRWWRTTGFYRNSPDLAVAFLERALELARPGGVVALLVPAKIATAGYGATARHALATSTTLQVIADLTGSGAAAFGATVYPLALITAKCSPNRHHQVRTTLSLPQQNSIAQAELAGGAPWILIGSGLTRLLAALHRDHPAVGDSVTCHLGVKTGLNHVFLNPPADLEPEVLRWAVRGRDVKPFRCSCRLRLLWSHDSAGQPVAHLPPKTEAYLRSHEAALRARRDYQAGPPWMVFRARPAAARHRVVWPDLARRLMAVSLTTTQDLECIPLNSCYVAPVSPPRHADALAAWLNSSWLAAIARLSAVPASGGFARFNAQVVSQLPFPVSAMADIELSRLARLARTGAEVRKELDQIAATHLRLSSSAQRALRAVLLDGTQHRR